MTSAQEFGWEKPLLKQKRFPKKSCPETVYADAMYKAGVYF